MAADSKSVLDVWELCTHCAEPADSVMLYHKLEQAAHKEFHDGDEPTNDSSGEAEWDMTRNPIRLELEGGKYRIFLTPAGEPYPHESWDPMMVLLVHADKAGQPDAFRVYRSKKEAMAELDKSPDTFELPELTLADGDGSLLCEFGQQYRCGKAAFDAEGALLTQPLIPQFNYAEHNRIGNSLTLKFDDGDRSGRQVLKLTEEHKPSWGDFFRKRAWNPVAALMLSYGQINGLGGDFYAGYTPICRGKTFDEQCSLFMEAFNLLATWKSVDEVANILKNRQEEVDMLEDASQNGKSTHEAYLRLVKPGTWKSGKLLPKSEEDLQYMTQNRDGPSYLVAAQINLDHFGDDARIAWQAGHFCALQEAAKPNANLERAYAMNAFADHYLADCFASGHMRTPRRVLHGSDTKLKVALNGIAELIKGIWNKGTWKGIAADVAPDLLAKAMHDEDNFLGLWVTRPSDGKEWQAFGDKKLLEKGDETNVECVSECLQADVDEVFSVYKSKTLISDPSKFAALQYMPSVIAKKNHEPLFTSDGKFRNYKPVVMPKWPEKYCVVEPTEAWDLYQALKENETFKKY